MERYGKYKIHCISPEQIDPPHSVYNWPKVQRMTRAFKKKGWTGRPLVLVPFACPAWARIATRKGSGTIHRVRRNQPGKFRSLTGSHRIAAARRARLSCVPAVVLPKGAVAALRRRDMLDEHGDPRIFAGNWLFYTLSYAGYKELAELAALGGLTHE